MTRKLEFFKLKEKTSEIINSHFSCTCDEAYKSRGLIDYNCVLHDRGEDIESAMEEYTKQQSIAFAEWVESHQYKRNGKYLWFDSLNDRSNSEHLTTAELYNLFLKENQTGTSLVNLNKRL